jgi:hypothetical protein
MEPVMNLFILLDASAIFRHPLPPWGYFAGKSFCLTGLDGVLLCKIFILNRLRLKYFLSMTYQLKWKPRLFGRGFSDLS